MFTVHPMTFIKNLSEVVFCTANVVFYISEKRCQFRTGMITADTLVTGLPGPSLPAHLGCPSISYKLPFDPHLQIGQSGTLSSSL